MTAQPQDPRLSAIPPHMLDLAQALARVLDALAEIESSYHNDWPNSVAVERLINIQAVVELKDLVNDGLARMGEAQAGSNLMQLLPLLFKNISAESYRDILSDATQLRQLAADGVQVADDVLMAFSGLNSRCWFLLERVAQ